MSTVEMTPEFLQKLPIIDHEKPKRSEKEEKWLREIISVEFLNVDEPGLMISFPYGNTKNNATLKFVHGGKYKVPRFIARYVNSRGTPRWERQPDGRGNMQKVRAGFKSRFQMRETMEME